MIRLRGARAAALPTAATDSWLERVSRRMSSINRTELLIFSKQMATFIRAGVPILDGIRVVREQADSKLFRWALDGVAQGLEEGEALSIALSRHPRVFSRLYVDMIVAAEASGEIDSILDQLARHLERGDSTSRKIRQAMLYPSIVVGLALVVVFILITFVLPSFARLFADFDADLPLPTQVLLGLGSLGERYGLLAGAVLLATVLLLWLWRDTRPLRSIRHRLVLRLPLVGRLVQLGIGSRFARMLGILLRAGVPITDALDIASAGTGNDVYRRRLLPVRDALFAGEQLSGPLARTGLFGALLLQMVKVGEATGTLERYLDDAANFMDDDLDYRTGQMVTLIEPAMIVVVALMVGFVALSVVTPMYGILSEIR